MVSEAVRKLIIDMQGAQSSGSAHRGIGRYTMALVRAMLENPRGFDIHLAFNGAYPERIDEVYDELGGLITPDRVHIWYVPKGIAAADLSRNQMRRSAEIIREKFLASLNPHIVLLTSPFEGFGDDCVSTAAGVEEGYLSATIVYDLIPYIYQDVYLAEPKTRALYHGQIEHVRRMDMRLTISSSSREECLRYLACDPETTISISGAVDEDFVPMPVKTEQEQIIRQAFKISGKFVMYTGGIDFRKNVDGLIRAYSQLSQDLIDEHQLVIVCSVRDEDRIRLNEECARCGLARDRVILTGFVSHEDLLSLYNLCHVFAFPSWHEGFGLPVLEAMSCGKPVIAADTSSIPEVVGRKEHLFQSSDDLAIRDKLEQVLTDSEFRQQLAEWGLERAKEFSWPISAEKALKALECRLEKTDVHSFKSDPRRGRLKLAMVCPLIPLKSGIARYMRSILPSLSQYYDMDIITDQEEVKDDWVIASSKIRSSSWFRDNANHYDRVVYQFGNSDYHSHMFELLSEIPGVTVLHDFYLSDVQYLNDMTRTRPGAFSAAVLQSHGWGALQEVATSQESWKLVKKYPANFDVIENSLGLCVHSEYARRQALELYGVNTFERFTKIPFVDMSPIPKAPRTARSRLNRNGDDIIVASFGHISPIKATDSLLKAWARSELATDEKAHLFICGECPDPVYLEKLRAIIADAPFPKNIHITDWLDDDQYRDYLAVTDLCVQLRVESRGETSAAVFDALAYGCPTIVNNSGSFAELPENCVEKIDEAFTLKMLSQVIDTLWKNEEQRLRMASEAKLYIEQKHSKVICSKAMMEAIEKAYAETKNDPASVYFKAVQQHDKPVSSEVSQELRTAIEASFGREPTRPTIFVDMTAFEAHLPDIVTPEERHMLETIFRYAPSSVRIVPIRFDAVLQQWLPSDDTVRGMLNIVTEIGTSVQAFPRRGDVVLLSSVDHEAEAIRFMRRHDAKIIAFDRAMDSSQNFVDKLLKIGSPLDIEGEDNTVVLPNRKTASFTEVALPERFEKWFHILLSRPSLLLDMTAAVNVDVELVRRGFDQMVRQGCSANLIILGDESQLEPSEQGDSFARVEVTPSTQGFRDLLSAHAVAALVMSSNSSLPISRAIEAGLALCILKKPMSAAKELEHAWYFEAETPLEFCHAMIEWLQLYEQKRHPRPYALSSLLPEQSARDLISALGI